VPRLISTTVFIVMMLSLSPAANGQSTDAAFRADIEKLMEVTGTSAIATQIATLTSNQIIDAMRQGQPNVPERAIVIIKEVLNGELSRAFAAPDGVMAKIVDIYARHFSHAEVLALLNFYSTDIGRKTISVMPMLAQEGAAAGQEWAAAKMPGVIATLQQRLRAEGFIK
jgi:hypothetical protein